MKRLLVALACVFALTGCGVQGAYESQDAQLRDALPDAQSAKNPRSFTGVSNVTDFEDVVAVAESPTPALPVELTDADGYDVSVTDVSRICLLYTSPSPRD